MAECIHGFDPGLCDSCYPKAVPAPVRRVTPSRVRVAASSSGSGRVATLGGTSRKSPVTLTDLRVYHVTHISNLDGILAAGHLSVDAHPSIDVSSGLTRELRRTAELASGQRVGDYVPFYLSPNATLWEQLRRGAGDATRWSAAARAAASGDFVFLVSTVRLLGPGYLIADGDAGNALTRFGAGGEAAERMLARLHGTEQLREAEALAESPFPFDSVTLIGVANDPMRDRVRGVLGDDAGYGASYGARHGTGYATGYGTKVAVYPPWFQGGTPAKTATAALSRVKP